MKRLREKAVGIAALALAAVPLTMPASPGNDKTWDVVVYGGTSAGVTTSVQVARMGGTAILIEPGSRLGGLSASGLGCTDIGSDEAKEYLGGISREFYERIWAHYQTDEAWVHETWDDYKDTLYWDYLPVVDEGIMWGFEPSVASRIFQDLIDEAGVTVVYGERLDRSGNGVSKDGATITSIRMESGREFRGRKFVDTTYEGDLMAEAGVSYTVGRESNDTYNERYNGVLVHPRRLPVDPYIERGNPASGMLPGITVGEPGQPGRGDSRLQAYNFRMTLTDAAENMVPIPKPEGYDPFQYELLLRLLEQGYAYPFGNHMMMPNRKTDTNNGNLFFCTDFVGRNWAYPEASYEERAAIVEAHRTYQMGLMWFLQNDPRVPADAREIVTGWGLPADEYTDNGHWPFQMYVREARRMVSDYVMTEHDCLRWVDTPEPVVIAGNPMDSHGIARFIDADGYLRVEGYFIEGVPPYPISYRSIVPRESEASNLLVPVCLSASHSAFGSIRMEPIFMALGQVAATAAVQAIAGDKSVQDVEYDRLRARLLEDDVRLELGPPPADRPITTKVDAPDLEGIVKDAAEAERIGSWAHSRALLPHVGGGYFHDGGANDGASRVRFTFDIGEPSSHELRMAWTADGNRATRVPVWIRDGNTVYRLFVDQRRAPGHDGLFESLGVYHFESDQIVVEISNEDAGGHVVVDAFQLLRREGG